ncbi:hypothetical protein IT774_05090 [Salinimonas marina]|uniref:Uncharacterized protein n=1 Tax=Salinimonas marina TaxID=2785918 RepID=A0A7S9DZ08_9ALTE|nr:hypothetical protein [Salinimonas marina]QPG06549.1 hypothetical protein IT774_05090 [Salinimonas marina]
MWIFTSKGMVSCVRHNKKPSTILVRARQKDHILEFIGVNNEHAYFFLDRCDYNHRAEIHEIEFKRLVLLQIDRIQYPDFKGSIPKDPSFNGYRLACGEVWQTMNDFKFGYYEPSARIYSEDYPPAKIDNQLPPVSQNFTDWYADEIGVENA